MLEKILQIASRITDPVAASVFAAAFLGLALYSVRKSNKKRIAWLLAFGLIIVGIAPLTSRLVLALRGIYRISVVVLGSDHQPVKDGVEVVAIDAEVKRTDSGWEVDVPPQAKPSDGNIRIYAKAASEFLAGSSLVTLGSDYYPSVEIPLSKAPSVMIRGEVVDRDQNAVPGAEVTLPQCSQSTSTDLHGLFSVASCVAEGQLVTIRAAKGKRSSSVTLPASNNVQIVLTKD